jgi:mRNA interferase HigB
MICKYHFGKNMIHLFILWIGTHSAYTKICNKNEQYNIGGYH